MAFVQWILPLIDSDGNSSVGMFIITASALFSVNSVRTAHCYFYLPIYRSVLTLYTHIFLSIFLTCIGFCSVNLTFYRQWRKFLSRDVYYRFFTLQCEQCPYSTLLLLLTYISLCHHIIHAHFFMHLLTCIGFCWVNLTCYLCVQIVHSHFFKHLTCIGFCSVNLTSYRQWRKFLSRDVYYRFFTLQCEQCLYSTLLLLLTYKVPPAVCHQIVHLTLLYASFNVHWLLFIESYLL